MMGMSNRTEINALFRQQWTSIQNSPKTIQVDFQHLFNSKISFGLNLYNDETVLLSSSGALATFGYRVNLTSEHILGFGIGGGFVSNRIDLDGIPDLDLLDPVLLKASNNFDFDSQFGVHYKYRNFVLGLSLLKLFDNRPLEESAVVKEKFDPFKDRAALIGYQIRLSDKFVLFPTAYYRATFTGVDYYEGSVLLKIKNTITIGGGYRTDFGIHGVVRIRIKDLHIGYSNDIPLGKKKTSLGNTNEFQLKILMGRIVPPRIANAESIEENLEAIDTTSLAINENPPEDTIEESVESEKEDVDVESLEKETTLEEATDEEEQPFTSPQPEEAKSNYDLVVGVFERKHNAEQLIREFRQAGIECAIKKFDEEKYHYVVVPKYATQTISFEKIKEIRKNNLFKEAWFKHFEK
jgi:type IX secretion system PorP/SprF family membrane protein